RRLLWQVVADAAAQRAVLVFARELFGVSGGRRVRRAVGVALHRDARHRDGRRYGQARFQRVVFTFAIGQAQAPAVVVDDDVHMVRIVEGRGAARIGRFVESPFRRCGLPDQMVEVAAVRLVAQAAALGGEIVLVPPFVFGLRRQRHLVAGR